MLTNNPDVMVIADALIEGRGEAAAAIASTVTASFDELLADLCARLVASHAKMWPTLERPTMRVEHRKRFARIIFGGSCWGWVELSNGLVWKSATRKAPALNYPRGCIFDDDSRAAMGLSIYGVTKFGPYHTELA